MTTARATAQLNRRAIVTGVQGQDGYYLSRMLLDRGYQVTGISRRHSSKYDRGPVHYDSEYREIEGDICDTSFMMSLIKKEQPNEFYNLAAQSHVGYSFENPDTTFDVNANAVLGMLEAIRLTSPHTKFYQASTSEMFGTVASGMASERTTLSPASPYGVAKTAAHHMVRVYRESYGLFACSGILFNHESSSQDSGSSYGQGLPRIIWVVCMFRYPVQPREFQTWKRFCDTKGHSIRGRLQTLCPYHRTEAQAR